MEVRRTKRYSAEGWKYVNTDGTLWPKDEWIKYSPKHPAPIPWDQVPDPSAPRDKVPLDLWQGAEDGHQRYLAIITIVRKLADEQQESVQQTHIYDFFPSKNGKRVGE